MKIDHIAHFWAGMAILAVTGSWPILIAAAFYCPYIPLMSSGVVLDPSTFEPVVSFMTRYGYIELTNTASSFGNAADYVGEIAVQNLTFQ